MNVAEYERVRPVTALELGDRRLVYVTPNRMTQWRALSLFEKEPSTIEWLESMGEGDRLLDVGANVGMYSVYAAVMRGVMVTAVEPEAQNFALLVQNIEKNGLWGRVDPWAIALSDKPGFARLHLSALAPGGSCHSYGQEVGFDLQPRPTKRQQGCAASSIDVMVEAGHWPQPDHVKVDVDGLEHDVLTGGERTLARVQSLLIEINPALAQHVEMRDRLLASGFTLDPEQVARATRTEGPFKGVAEHVFRR